MPTLPQLHRSTYECLTNLKTRCYNKNYVDFRRYGGRGITVCDRWLHGETGHTGFECFLQDMGPKPDGLTLERRDNDGAYCKENCVWACRRTQAINRHNTIWATVDGVTLFAQQWADYLGVSRNAFYTRTRRYGCEAAVRHYLQHGLWKRAKL
jgi:hypothetical protein